MWEVSISKSSFIPGMQGPGLGTRHRQGWWMLVLILKEICNEKLMCQILNSSRLVEQNALHSWVANKWVQYFCSDLFPNWMLWQSHRHQSVGCPICVSVFSVGYSSRWLGMEVRGLYVSPWYWFLTVNRPVNTSCFSDLELCYQPVYNFMCQKIQLGSFSALLVHSIRWGHLLDAFKSLLD